MDVPQAPAGRRPLATRGAAWARALAGWLARRRVPPNAISATSLLFAAAAGACWLGTLRCPDHVGDIALLIGAAVCIQLRLLCNLFDGMVAVEGGLRSPTGELWNDVPDRFADALILVPVGYATGLAWGPELGWVAGMAALLTAYQRWVGAGVGRGQDFGGPMAKPQRMAVLTVAALVAAAARPWQYDGHVLFAALGVVVIGALLTVALRLRRLARRMGTPP